MKWARGVLGPLNGRWSDGRSLPKSWLRSTSGKTSPAPARVLDGQSARRAPLRSFLVPLFLTLAVFVVGTALFVYRNLPHSTSVTQFTVEDEGVAPTTARRVRVGFYLNRVWGVDIGKGEFSADLYMWFRWRAATVETLSYEFMNGLNVTTVEFTDDSNQFVDGWNYRGYRVQGTFLADFKLQEYPFDEQVIAIQIEDAANSRTVQVFEIDRETGMAPEWILTDWRIAGATARHDTHLFETSFGDPQEPGSSEYSRVSLELSLGRVVFPYLLKTVLPLLVITLVAGLSFYVHPREMEVRSGMCVTTLLAAIALHLSGNDGLPRVGYSTVMDQFFVFSYLLILLAMVQTVANGRLVRLHETRALRYDRMSGLVFVLLLVVGFMVISPA